AFLAATISAAVGASMRGRGPVNLMSRKISRRSAQAGLRQVAQKVRAVLRTISAMRAAARRGLPPCSSGADHSVCECRTSRPSTASTRRAPTDHFWQVEPSSPYHALEASSRHPYDVYARMITDAADRTVEGCIATSATGKPVLHLGSEAMAAGDKC